MKMVKLKFIFLAIFTFFCIFTKLVFAQESIRLATTTSIYETGLLENILPPFENKYNLKVHIISTGTGKAIQLAKNGDVDVILVHDPEAEEEFVAEGFGINRRDVAYNDFLIIGPKEDPAEIKALNDARSALAKIMQLKLTFISRGDDSGTHKKELNIWGKIGATPEGSWYLETGQGMAQTLRIADEKNAYTIIDRATYLSNREKIRLKNLLEADKDLLNYYSVIAVNPNRYPHVKFELAMALIDWLTSPECQNMISEYRRNGEQLFHASATNPL